MYLDRDMERAIALMASGEIDAAPLISMVRPLDEAPEAYAAAAQTGNMVKVLVRMN
jgi:threonine dehydrogenase-like Zn-dependent dehydrogenase